MKVGPDPEVEGTTCVDLLDMEAEAMMYLSGVTTVTFFEGPVPAEQLRERLVRVVQASPWLAGKLVKRKKQTGKGKGVQMVYDSSPTEQLVLSNLLEEVDLDISATMSCEALMETMKGTRAHIKEDGFTLLKKGLSYTRVTVAKKDATTWALVVSLSHAIADGYTYYKVLGMLSADQEIVPLNATRRHSFVPALKEAVGPEVYSTYMGGNMMNLMSTMTFGGKPRATTFYVDMEKVEEAKARSSGTDFVSTNDVLTAFWGRLTQARLLEMSVNFRGRLPELKAEDAGNYEGCILFSTADFADPSSIRKALQRGDGKFQSTLEPPQPLPGFREMCRCKYRIISNWASFFSVLKFDGCVQRLHLPYLALAEMPTDILIIFRPTPDTFGVFIVTRSLSDEVLTGSDSLLGRQILVPAS